MDINNNPYYQDHYFGKTSDGLIILKRPADMLLINANSPERKSYIEAKKQLDALHEGYYSSDAYNMSNGEFRQGTGGTIGLIGGICLLVLTIGSLGAAPALVSAALALGFFGVVGLSALIIRSGLKQENKRYAAKAEYYKSRDGLEKIINAEKARLATELYLKKHPDLAAATVAMPAQTIAPNHAQIRTQPRAARINHGMPQP